MVKFILVLQLCTSAMCFPPVTNDSFKFDSYRECAIAGYSEASKMFQKFDSVHVELNKPILRFWCQKENKQNI